MTESVLGLAGLAAKGPGHLGQRFGLMRLTSPKADTFAASAILSLAGHACATGITLCLLIAAMPNPVPLPPPPSPLLLEKVSTLGAIGDSEPTEWPTEPELSSVVLSGASGKAVHVVLSADCVISF